MLLIRQHYPKSFVYNVTAKYFWLTGSVDRTPPAPGTKLRINQPPGQEHKSEIRSILRNSRREEEQEKVKRTASLDRKKVPKLLQAYDLNEGQTMKVYTQSATDYSATEEDEDLEGRKAEKKKELLSVPSQGKIKKSKSFAGQLNVL